MASGIFVNLAIQNLNASMAFFATLDCHFAPRFRDAAAACVTGGKNSQGHAADRGKAQGVHPQADIARQKTTEVLLCLACESRDRVNDLVRKAVDAGGSTHAESRDCGFM